MARHMILSKLDKITSSASLTRKVAFVMATEENQKVFTIPMENFNKHSHLFDVRIGTTWFSDERYDIVDDTIVLKEEEEGIEIGRKVSFVFTYIQEL